jgi:hypothetical protein
MATTFFCSETDSDSCRSASLSSSGDDTLDDSLSGISLAKIATASTMSFYPDPRRVVTGHDDNGNAIFVADSQVPCVPVPANCNSAVLYETHDFPVPSDEWNGPIVHRTRDLSNRDGIVLRAIDFKPNTKTVSRGCS